MGLSNIVDVQITRETKVPTQKGFGTLLIVGDTDNFALGERIRTYSSVAAVLADFALTDPEYLMAVQAFGQSVKPEQIKIGQVEALDSGDYTVALAAIEQLDNDWYGLAIESETEADINAVAAFIEARIKLFFALTRDADALNNVGGNILEDLNTAAYDRSIGLYSGAAATQFLSTGLAGGQLPKLPGSITWKFKSVAGVAFDALTDTERGNILINKGNVYVNVAGLNMIEEGTVASGEFIDVMRGSDWITARMQESIFQELINSDKIPFTNSGIAKIENRMREVLNQAVTNGIISDFTITTPDVSAISALDKGNRLLQGIEFEGTLQGAIHKVKIAGRLVL